MAQNHPVGATFSYCNSGFNLAGRVVEKLTRSTWDAALRSRLLEPLGLKHTVTLPEEAILFRAAVGHIDDGAGGSKVTPKWDLPRSAGPAGLVIASAADVLGFARMHLNAGRAPDGTQVLSEESAAAMQERQTDLPDAHTLGDSWGIGWIRFGWGDHRLVGHDGNTIGQSAFLRVLPSHGVAVTLLLNGGHGRDLYEDLYREIFAEVAGVEMPTPLTPPETAPDVDPAKYVGSYERSGVLTEVLDRDGTLVMRTTVSGPLAELSPEPTKEHDLVPVGPDHFAMRDPEVQSWTSVTFYQLADGSPYVHYGVRANPKKS